MLLSALLNTHDDNLVKQKYCTTNDQQFALIAQLAMAVYQSEIYTVSHLNPLAELISCSHRFSKSPSTNCLQVINKTPVVISKSTNVQTPSSNGEYTTLGYQENCPSSYPRPQRYKHTSYADNLILNFQLKGVCSLVESPRQGKQVGLTRHKTAEGQSSLSNKVSPNRVMVPDKKSHQSHFGHVDGKSERFLPNRIKPCKTHRTEIWGSKSFASTSLNFHDT